MAVLGIAMRLLSWFSRKFVSHWEDLKYGKYV